MKGATNVLFQGNPLVHRRLRLWSDWVDVQTDLSLHWLPMLKQVFSNHLGKKFSASIWITRNVCREHALRKKQQMFRFREHRRYSSRLSEVSCYKHLTCLVHTGSLDSGEHFGFIKEVKAIYISAYELPLNKDGYVTNCQTYGSLCTDSGKS